MEKKHRLGRPNKRCLVQNQLLLSFFVVAVVAIVADVVVVVVADVVVVAVVADVVVVVAVVAGCLVDVE